MDAPRPQRNRIHIDVYLPPDQVQARISAALAAGGRVVADRAPDWWTLADPEGNEVDLAIPTRFAVDTPASSRSIRMEEYRHVRTKSRL
jgi:hypothetical protein